MKDRRKDSHLNKINCRIYNIWAAVSIVFIISQMFLISQSNAETGLVVASKHHGGGEYNEVNPGLIQYWQDTDRYYFAGAYKNSYSNMSGIIGVGTGNMFFSEAALLTGYDKDVTFAAQFGVHVGFVKIGYAPARLLGVGSSDIFTLQLVF